jgi:hypothetical protein
LSDGKRQGPSGVRVSDLGDGWSTTLGKRELRIHG